MMQTRRRLAAIMFTDMVDYSAMTQADEANALLILDRHNRLLRPIFSKFNGREVKTVGDAFLVEFESALDSAKCALKVQRVLHDHNVASPKRPIRIRIGIHVGDVIHAAGDVFGDTVNIASRIQSLAEPEGICLTQQVYDQVHTKIPTELAKLPPVALKNIRSPQGVYKVVQPWAPRVRERAVPEAGVGRNLAVLPLANISEDLSDEYFADGLTEELISVLSQVRGLSVIARTSVASYKSTPKSVATIGSELGVDTVLEGSVRKAGRRIRITLQLIDVGTQHHIWASTYDREIGDVFAVQTEIAERTAEALRLEFAKGERSRTRDKPTQNPAAYDLYLRGLVAEHELQGRGYDQAIRSYEQATTLDPEFAEAFAAWADLYVKAAGDYMPMREVMPRARELASRALELDPDSSLAHAALANIALQFDHDWKLAEQEFRTAILLNPSNDTAHQFLAILLITLGRLEEAREVIRAGTRLNPAGRLHHFMVMADMAAGDYAPVIEHQQGEVERDPASVGKRVHLGLTYLAAGRREAALQQADTPLAGTSDDERFDHALLNALVGRPDAARAVAAEAERGQAKSYTSATHLAMLYAALGDRARALDLLEKDARDGDRVLWLWYRGVWFDSIRQDPRFVALLHHYGLPTRVSDGPRTSEPEKAPTGVARQSRRKRATREHGEVPSGGFPSEIP
jgi:adenylate cyclase